MKYLRLVVVGIFIGLGAVAVVYASRSLSGNCSAFYRPDKTITIGKSSLSAEVASTAGQQSQGLGGRQCIGADQAMLFTFNQPSQYKFWMKGMKFPVDMVWVGSDKRAVYIKSNVQPDTYPQTFTSAKPAQYVLELKAGQAAKLGLTEGTSVNF